MWVRHGSQSEERVIERLELFGLLFMQKLGVLCLYSLTKLGV